MGHGAEGPEVPLPVDLPDRDLAARPEDRSTRRQPASSARTDEGQTWEAISPDLTRNDAGHAGLLRRPDHEGQHGRRGTTAPSSRFAESPRRGGMLWAGTDDGLVQRLARRRARRGRTSRRRTCPSGAMVSSDRALAARPGGRLRGRHALQARRHAPVSLQDDRLREDVDEDRERHPGRRVHARRARGPRAPRASLRRHGDGRLRLVRRRRHVAAVPAESAGRARHGPHDQGRRPRRRDAGPRVLDPRRRRAPRDVERGRREERAAPFPPESGRAIRFDRRLFGPGTRPPSRRRTEPARGRSHRVLAEGRAPEEGHGKGCGRDRDPRRGQGSPPLHERKARRGGRARGGPQRRRREASRAEAGPQSFRVGPSHVEAVARSKGHPLGQQGRPAGRARHVHRAIEEGRDRSDRAARGAREPESQGLACRSEEAGGFSRGSARPPFGDARSRARLPRRQAPGEGDRGAGREARQEGATRPEGQGVVREALGPRGKAREPESQERAGRAELPAAARSSVRRCRERRLLGRGGALEGRHRVPRRAGGPPLRPEETAQGRSRHRPCGLQQDGSGAGHPARRGVAERAEALRRPMDLSRRDTLRVFGATAAGALLGTSGAGASPEPILRAIPSSGERIPVVGLGTWSTFDVGSAAARAPLEEVLARFVERGGRVVDSSPMYGQSEEVVGAIAAKRGLTDRLFLATKVWTRGREAGLRQIETSERLLGTEASRSPPGAQPARPRDAPRDASRDEGRGTRALHRRHALHRERVSRSSSASFCGKSWTSSR